MMSESGFAFDIDTEALFVALNQHPAIRSAVYKRANIVVQRLRKFDAEKGGNHNFRIVEDISDIGRYIAKFAYDTDDTPEDEREIRALFSKATYGGY